MSEWLQDRILFLLLSTALCVKNANSACIAAVFEMYVNCEK